MCFTLIWNKTLVKSDIMPSPIPKQKFEDLMLLSNTIVYLKMVLVLKVCIRNGKYPCVEWKDRLVDILGKGTNKVN